jgi:general secretion pathway protein F
MAVFEFKGINKNGKEIKGIRNSDTESQLKSLLANEGIFVTNIKSIKQKIITSNSKSAFFQKKVTAEDLSIMTKQLSVLIRSGITLVESLTALIDQTEEDNFKMVLSQVKQEVNEGISFADALKKHPKIFSNLYVSMIQAGESSGTLDIVLDRLSEFTVKQAKLKRKVISSLAYPVIMVFISVLVVGALFIFVIPKITALFIKMKAALPPVTNFLIAISNFLASYWLFIIFVIVVFVYLFKKWIATPEGRNKFDEFKLNMPIFGSIIRMNAIARFSTTLATLLKNGVPLLTAFKIVKNVVDNTIIQEAIEEASIAIKEGESIAKPLKKSGYFPAIVIHMIAIGEKSGQLEEMLENIGESYESQVENKLSALTTILEPIIIVMLGGVVLVVVMAIMMPLMKMNQLAKGH